MILLLSACASQTATLQTHDPEANEFRLVFGRMLLRDKETPNVAGPDRQRDFEAQLNLLLKEDVNTLDCVVVEDSIHFGEPGSFGTARVRCLTSPTLQVSDKVFDGAGKAMLYYTLSQ